MDNKSTPQRFEIDPAANDYLMALCRAIGDCLAAVERHEPSGPFPVRVPGWEAASTPWTLRAGDVAPKWRLDRHEGGRIVHALAFVNNIDQAAIAMLRYDRLHPLVTAETLWASAAESDREVLARAEALGFVREPTIGTIGGPDPYVEHEAEDAQEAREWLASDGPQEHAAHVVAARSGKGVEAHA